MSDTDGRPFASPPPDDDARLTQHLRGLRSSVPMPRDVSIRIAAAIEAESRDARERGSIDVPAEAPVSEPAPRGWFRRRAPQVLAAAAGIGVLTFGLYLVGTGGSGGDSLAGGSDSDQPASAPEAAQDRAEEEMGPAQDDPLSGLNEPSPQDDAGDGTAAGADQELAALVAGLAASPSEVSAGCGAAYADSIDAVLLGSAGVDEGVLVVTTVEGTATAEGWTLASCGATDVLAGTDPVVVSRPTP